MLYLPTLLALTTDNKMTKIKKDALLVYYGDGEHVTWLVDTTARMLTAFRELFTLIDELGYYCDENQCQLDLARSGNLQAIYSILRRHNGCPYETWHLKSLRIPENKV
jgi:hypothetical protein